MTIAIPQEAQRIGPVASAGIYLRSILFDVAHKILRRRKRDEGQVAADYDSGEWAQQRASRSWESSATLQDYVDKQWLDATMRAHLEGKLWRVPARHYYPYRRKMVSEILSKYAGSEERLVEVGSGTGTNLFALSLDNRWAELVGLELSPTGREVGRLVADHFDVAAIRFAEIDLLDPDSPGFLELPGQTIFTHYCLEQLPSHTMAVFRNLIAAGIKRAVMIEPSFELLNWHSLRDLASITYVLRQDYQRTLIAVAKQLEREGLIRIIEVRRLDFVSGPRNSPTLLVWDVV